MEGEAEIEEMNELVKATKLNEKFATRKISKRSEHSKAKPG